MDRLFARITIAAAAIALAGGVGCSSSSSTSSSAGGSEAGDLSASEKDISNEGPSTHEFVIIKTDDAPDALPVKDNEVQEDGLNVVDEQEDIAPSTTGVLQTNLEAGSYVIICNLPAHYESGMHTAFTVD